MPDLPETTANKRFQRIEQLKNRLEKKWGKLKEDNRKERNRQLIAFGIYVEESYKMSNNDTKQLIENDIKKYLTGRNLEKALAGLSRLNTI